MGMHVVVEGTIGDGFMVFGPFKTGPEAIEWAEQNCTDYWEALPLAAPEDH